MKKYDYFFNVKDNAVFTEKRCQFCGTNKECLEGFYFEQPKIESVCLSCLDNKKIGVSIPEYIKNRIKNNRTLKSNILEYTPPIPWIQYNDWQVCCDDYMQYIGEWQQEDFIRESLDGDGISVLRSLLCAHTLSKVDDINVLWEDIGYDTAAFVFKCSKCGKKTIVCQSY